MAKNTKVQNTKVAEKEISAPINSVEEKEVVATKVETKVEEPVVEVKKETGTRTVSKPVVELQDNDSIEVYSNVPNLSYHDKTTGMTTSWENIGDMMFMTFGELKVMYKTAPSYMNKLLIAFNDSRVDEYFRITATRELYDRLFKMDLNKQENMVEWREVYDKLGRLNPNIKPNILTRIQAMVRDNQLNNINCIKDIEGVFRVSGILY